MKPHIFVLAISVALVAPGCEENRNSGAPTVLPRQTTLSFFVSSAKSTTGNLGGLRGADSLCQNLAAAVGFGNKNWRAYLSAERDPDNANRPTDARSRIGTGPWFNATGVIVARDLDELHARRGDASVFVDERGQRIPGQWPGSPGPNEHDILTGSTSQGTLMSGLTCEDWNSSATAGGSLRWPWAGRQHVRDVPVMELVACESELRQHRSPRRRGSNLLLREELTIGA